jgi:hypothetical protein
MFILKHTKYSVMRPITNIIIILAIALFAFYLIIKFNSKYLPDKFIYIAILSFLVILFFYVILWISTFLYFLSENPEKLKTKTTSHLKK